MVAVAAVFDRDEVAYDARLCQALVEVDGLGVGDEGIGGAVDDEGGGVVA